MRKIISIIILAMISIPAFSAMPEWVVNPYSDYPDSTYIAASGIGMTRDEAEADAISSIASFFGVSVETLTEVQTEEEISSDEGGSSYSSLSSGSSLSVSMGNLAGVTVKEHASDGTFHYALAVMDKSSAVTYYFAQARMISGRIEKELKDAEKRFGDLSAYQMVNSLILEAEQLDEMISVLNVLSPSISSTLSGRMVEVNSFAERYRDSIEISSRIERDIDGSLEKAVDDFITSNGFASSDDGERYLIRGGVDIYTSDAPRSMVYADYDVYLELYDQDEGDTVFSFSYSGREGHRSEAQAIRRIAVRIKDIVQNEFAASFSENFGT